VRHACSWGRLLDSADTCASEYLGSEVFSSAHAFGKLYETPNPCTKPPTPTPPLLFPVNTQVRWRLSTASTLEEAQAEIVVGLRDVLVRKGDGKQWLVKAFQVPLLSAAR
jgi:hypothetical protein